MKYLNIIILALGLIFTACEDEDMAGNYDSPGPDDLVVDLCIVERSCFTDPFYTSPEDGFGDNRDELLREYMQDRGLKVFAIQIEEDFFEAVCEACHICPSGDVFSVRTNQDTREVLLSQGIWLVDCLNEKEKVRLDYHATKCADPWLTYLPNDGTTATDEDLAFAIVRYFDEKDVDIFQIIFFEAEGQDCEACSCLDEYGITIEIDADDIHTVIEDGFKEF
jgi:hypothetical protein